MQRQVTVLLAWALVIAPLGAQAADLVVWWEKGFYAQEDEAVAEIIAAFEQESGKQVELVQYSSDESDKALADIETGQPPDFFFLPLFTERWVPKWAYEGRLVDLEGALGPVLDLFDSDMLEAATLLNGTTGRRGLYALPMGRSANHVHVWKSLLERGGFSLDDIPQDWEAFWSFWCDQVQPAVRKALGRDDIWGAGLFMSAASLETHDQLFQFQLAYEATWLGAGSQLQVDDSQVRQGIVKALEDYTAIWRKGCTPPDSASATFNNNKAFLDQRVVMTTNGTLSIPIALRAKSEEDYYNNAVTIDWPNGANGRPLVIEGFVARAAVFEAGGHTAVADDFVRFLAEEGWLAHWLTFAGDRRLPPMRKLVEQPFWLDPTDPHRMRAAVQILSRSHFIQTEMRDDWRSAQIWDENVWGNAVHRVVADGISPEQAVDEAIARIKEILSE